MSRFGLPTKIWNSATKTWTSTGLPESSRPMPQYDLGYADPTIPSRYEMVLTRYVGPDEAAMLMAAGYVKDADGVLCWPIDAKAKEG